jgi:hypothetical protein
MALVQGPQERVDLTGPQRAPAPFVLAADGIAHELRDCNVPRPERGHACGIL